MTEREAASGAIRITVGIDRDGVVGAVSSRSDRPVDACRILTGLPARKAAAMVPLLFAVCGQAQGIAALRLVEAATAVRASAETEHARDLLLLIEAGLSHAFRTRIDLPRAIGRAPDPAPVAPVIRAALVLRAALFPDGRFVSAEGHSVLPRAHPDDADIRALRGALAAGLRALLTDGLDGAATSRALGLAAEGCFDGPRLAEPDLTVLGGALAREDGFAAEPHLDGFVAEVGPGALHHAEGRSLAGRLAAQRAAGLALADRLDGSVAEDLADVMAALGSTGRAVADGHAAWVRTARGPLLHWAKLDRDGRVAAWRSCAPTEWHFRSGGPVDRALLGSRLGKEPERAAALIAHSFDACVPVRCRILPMEAWDGHA